MHPVGTERLWHIYETPLGYVHVIYYIDYMHMCDIQKYSLYITLSNMYIEIHCMQFVEIKYMYVNNAETNNVHLMHLDTV